MINKKIYYKQILNEWIQEKNFNVKNSSILRYKSIIDININPLLGDIIFKKMSVCDIYNFFENDKIIYLSTSTRKLILIIIKSSIQYGINNNYRKNFPRLDIKIKLPKGRIDYFSKKEQMILEKYLKDNININNLAILFDFYTGIRLGELCALKWSDIDFINSTVSITKSVKRIKNKNSSDANKTMLVIESPKTEYSVRIIPIPLFIIDILKKYRTFEDNFIFTNNNVPKDPRTLEKYFEKLLIKCGLKKHTFHSIRHTYATRSRESGMDIKILSELLGHSNYRVTLDIYVHTSLDFKKDSINSLVKYLES